MHLAGVWDRNGIANGADKIRLYVNGDVVASTTIGGWGSVVGQYADIAGGNDQNIAGQFAIDNLKVYDVALTDFSDRFIESSIPEPANSCLGIIGLLVIGMSRARALTRRPAELVLSNRTASTHNSLTRELLRQFTGLDARFLAHAISIGKRRRGTCETDLT